MAVILRTTALITGSGLLGGGLSTLYWAPGSVGGSTADATDCLARFRGLWVSIAPRLSSTISFVFDQTVLAIEATTGVLTGSFTAAPALTVVGGSASEPLPRQTQGLIRWGTASVIGGRRVRGRLFVPGVQEGDNDGTGSPVSAFVSALTTAGATVFIAGATSSEACVWHRPVGGTGGASPDITAASGSPTWAVLRSRRA
jgi:hypothetical protein